MRSDNNWSVPTSPRQFNIGFTIDTSVDLIGAVTLMYGNHPYIVGGVENIDYQTNAAFISGYLRSITNNSYSIVLTVIVMVCRQS